MDFTDLFVSLNGQSYPSLAAATAAGAPTINYGVFINTVINFLIVALALFLILKPINKLKKKPEGKTTDCPYCKESIPKEAVRCPHCTSDLKSHAIIEA